MSCIRGRSMHNKRTNYNYNVLPKRVQSTATGAVPVGDIELLSVVRSIRERGSSRSGESSFSIGECSHGRCSWRRGSFSFISLSFLRHEPPPVVAPGLRTNDLDTPWRDATHVEPQDDRRWTRFYFIQYSGYLHS